MAKYILYFGTITITTKTDQCSGLDFAPVSNLELLSAKFTYWKINDTKNIIFIIIISVLESSNFIWIFEMKNTEILKQYITWPFFPSKIVRVLFTSGDWVRKVDNIRHKCPTWNWNSFRFKYYVVKERY